MKQDRLPPFNTPLKIVGFNLFLFFLIYQKTPMHRAATKGHKDAVQLLIRKGADVNIKDNDGVGI